LHRDLSAKVRKVAHHSSVDQWPGLIERVRPSIALIGVGADNPHGRPTSAAQAALAAQGVAVWRTDESVMVAIVDRGGPLAVSVR